jgi:hypothetical protein
MMMIVSMIGLRWTTIITGRKTQKISVFKRRIAKMSEQTPFTKDIIIKKKGEKYNETEILNCLSPMDLSIFKYFLSVNKNGTRFHSRIFCEEVEQYESEIEDNPWLGPIFSPESHKNDEIKQINEEIYSVQKVYDYDELGIDRDYYRQPEEYWNKGKLLYEILTL